MFKCNFLLFYKKIIRVFVGVTEIDLVETAIGQIYNLVEMRIGGKEKGTLLVEMCAAQKNCISFPI